ncbi:DUF6945 domain-containing protein [Pseudomonas marginalis]|uniref:DUF6945 domain-containing protein n=1 Tax=Pseudomonas marginalis TaxID=298 RepID=UPI0011B7094D|nr:helix-turn-helix domain-containing protein [Pseudomonas marginalis]KAA8552162.1 hypothetical protein FX984_04673 [Pseudomonas marginalis]TWR74112.1 helix-turn-helix domain-containing protein [Pseudomonas marginalis]
MTETFCKLTHEIMKATHWTSRTTGEQFKLTGDQKIMWAWMEKRYIFFRSIGKDWFDNQEDIAAATGCDPSTVKRFIAKLIQHGYIEVQRQKGRGFIRSNNYKILAPLQVCTSKVSTSSSRVIGEVAFPAVVDSYSVPAIASQELAGDMVPVFEDIPLEAYIDTPSQAPVVVHKRLQLFGDTLDEVPDVAAPAIRQGATVEYVGDPLPWD